MIVSGSQEAKPSCYCMVAAEILRCGLIMLLLSRHFQVYEIDSIAEAGKSVGTKLTKVPEFSILLKEIFKAKKEGFAHTFVAVG